MDAEQSMTITINMSGFWSEFSVANIPNGAFVYFVFAGVKLGNGRCHIDRLLYVGGRENEYQYIVGQEFKIRTNPLLSNGEILYFASGNTLGDRLLAARAVSQHFSTPIPSELNIPHDRIRVEIHIDGKLPKIFTDGNLFFVEIEEKCEPSENKGEA